MLIVSNLYEIENVLFAHFS